MDIIKKIKLDFYDNQITTVNAKQYDVASRYIQASCYANGEHVQLNENNLAAYIRCRKPDECYVFNNCSITENGDLLIELSKQMLLTPGLCLTDVVIVDTSDGGTPPVITDEGELQFDGSSSIISTMNFYVNVVPAPYNYDDLVSSGEVDVLDNLLDQVYQNYTELESLISVIQASAETAQSAAQTAQEAVAGIDLSSVIQSSTTEPTTQPINGLWLKEI